MIHIFSIPRPVVRLHIIGYLGVDDFIRLQRTCKYFYKNFTVTDSNWYFNIEFIDKVFAGYATLEIFRIVSSKSPFFTHESNLYNSACIYGDITAMKKFEEKFAYFRYDVIISNIIEMKREDYNSTIIVFCQDKDMSNLDSDTWIKIIENCDYKTIFTLFKQCKDILNKPKYRDVIFYNLKSYLLSKSIFTNLVIPVHKHIITAILLSKFDIAEYIKSNICYVDYKSYIVDDGVFEAILKIVHSLSDHEIFLCFARMCRIINKNGIDYFIVNHSKSLLKYSTYIIEECFPYYAPYIYHDNFKSVVITNTMLAELFSELIRNDHYSIIYRLLADYKHIISGDTHCILYTSGNIDLIKHITQNNNLECCFMCLNKYFSKICKPNNLENIKYFFSLQYCRKSTVAMCAFDIATELKVYDVMEYIISLPFYVPSFLTLPPYSNRILKMMINKYDITKVYSKRFLKLFTYFKYLGRSGWKLSIDDQIVTI